MANDEGEVDAALAARRSDRLWKADLKEALDAIQTYGDFAVMCRYSQHANPGLKIGNTSITLPFDLAQLPILQDAAQQVPDRGNPNDGSGAKKLELDASSFLITNPAWEAFFTTAFQDTMQSLGMTNVKPDLKKLVLYCPHSSSKHHVDLPKTLGVVIGKLKIYLSSNYKGGKMHLSHSGKTHVFDTSGSSFDVFALV